jgi:uncharacterized membrane protein
MKTERRAPAFIIFIVWVLATLRSECLVDTDQKCVIMFGGVVLNLGLDGDTWELYDRRVYLPLVMRGS